MATLRLTGRSTRYVPTWLGNHEQDEPFSVRIRRLTAGEVAAFRAGWAELIERTKGVVSGAELVELFRPAVEGPFGLLVVDEHKVAEGDLAGLLEVAAREHQLIGDPLAVELAQRVALFNELSAEAEGKSERRPGGSGTGQEVARETGTPLPPDAPAAASSSTPAST